MVSQLIDKPVSQATSRDAILVAATQVFMESGFSGARVDLIAREAKANKAMIYYHFGSKHGLYRAVLLRLFADVVEGVNRLKDSDLSAEERLRTLYTRITQRFAEEPALPKIMLREVLAGGGAMDKETSKVLGHILGFVAETINEGVKQKKFKPTHPLIAHMSVLAPLLIFFAGRSFRERVFPREMPNVPLPTDDDLLAHVLSSLHTTLAVESHPKTH